jgi:hypothetical protein
MKTGRKSVGSGWLQLKEVVSNWWRVARDLRKLPSALTPRITSHEPRPSNACRPEEGEGVKGVPSIVLTTKYTLPDLSFDSAYPTRIGALAVGSDSGDPSRIAALGRPSLVFSRSLAFRTFASSLWRRRLPHGSTLPYNLSPACPGLRRIIFALFLILLSPLVTSHKSLSLNAQSTNAAIIGQITDAQGKNVPGADVEAVAILTNVKYDTKTNSDGIYSFPALPPTDYRLDVKKDGFKEINKVGITLHVQDTLEQNFKLDVGSVTESITVGAAEGTSQGITVYGEAENMNTTDATVSTTIDRNFAENLPLNGRSFQTLLLLTPGTAFTVGGNGSDGGTFSVNGQRANANNFTVDGVSANLGGNLLHGGLSAFNGANPDFTIGGTTQGMVSVDALEEFKIQTSTYAPEFGRQPGGQVSLLTRSGTNGFHGTASDYLRNTILDANNWFNDELGRPKAVDKQNDFGGTVGGPILKDRTFFFFSYEGLRLLQPVANTQIVPSVSLRNSAATSFRPLMNYFPIPNGTDFGNGTAQYFLDTSLPTDSDAYTVKVDQALGKRAHLFGRFSNTTSMDERILHFDPGTFLSTKLRSRTGTVGADFAITPKLANELRLNYSVNVSSYTYGPSHVGGGQLFDTSVLYPKPFVQGTDKAEWDLVLGGLDSEMAFGPQAKYSQRQIQLIDNLSNTIGRHQLRWGVDYRRLFPIDAGAGGFVDYSVYSQNDLTNGVVSQTGTSAFIVAHPIYTNLSLFMQDTWKVSNHLTLTYGLRWELNPIPTDRDGLTKYFLNVVGVANPATATLAPPGTSEFKTTYGNFAPRIGVAYQLRQTPGLEAVVRGGFGVFYDLNSQTFAENFTDGAFNATAVPVNNLQFPLANNSVTIPQVPAPFNPPSYDILTGIDPNLKLPYTLQWNVSIEQALGRAQSLTASYVASAGMRLLRQDFLYDFSQKFQNVQTLRNASTSNYQSLQLQFNRQLSHGLQALASYTYSHSIDNQSDAENVYAATAEGFGNPNVDRGNSDFDLRHAFRGALTYRIPAWNTNLLSKTIFGGWSIDTIGLAQSGAPVDLVGGYTFNYIGTVRPDIVPNQPLYLYGSACAAINVVNNSPSPCPGGRGINPAAFTLVPTDSNGIATRQGTLGRNVLRGFGAWQMDFAIHRQFNLTERLNLQFRSEFFNIFNHPNFGSVDNFVGDGTFGQATGTLNDNLGGLNSLYQIGGPRSIQLALKLAF